MEDKAIVGISTGSGTHRIKESTLLACLRCGLWQLEGEYAQAVDALDFPDLDPCDPDPPKFDPNPELDRLIGEMNQIQGLIEFIEPPNPAKEIPF